MNTRLKIVCVLFGIVYFYFVGASVIDTIPDFIEGFNEGMKKANEQFGKDSYKKTDKALIENGQTETVFFRVKPKSGFFSFPSSIMNLKTGNPIRAEFPILIAKVDKTQLPLQVKIVYGILLLFTLPLFFVVVYIPIQIYRLIRSIVKNEIFEPLNIKRIRRIGYCLLYVFAIEVFGTFIHTFQAHTLIDLEDYKIIFKMNVEYYWLLFALVTLMFAEVLKISHTMKEEQDLTI